MLWTLTKLTVTCPKSTKETLEKTYEKLHVKIKNNDTIFIAKFEWILHTVLMFPLLTLDK